ncbi:hypothetical protein GCM10008967_28450 [Bacillus carboniphilus]|uniref:Uncharacterized protein n=1 Tax=Bacillus carboniphilus TaxID=86663 RepID=A0ABN0WG33_9BACI
MNNQKLLPALSRLWNNRNIEEQTTPEKWIREDLLDEQTHPRLRKGKQERFYLAIKKITCADFLNAADKVALINLYIEVLEDLNEN